MQINQSKAVNFLFVIVFLSFLSACNPSKSQTNVAPEMEMPWKQAGNTYTYDSVYDRPEGVSNDTFMVTIGKNGLINSAEAVVPDDGGKHAEGLVRFNEALSPVIVGKNLSELEEFDTLGSYSLTTAAFNKALEELKQQVESAS